MRTKTECCFCPSMDAKLSGEHIWSEWMGKLFPELGKTRVTFGKLDLHGSIVLQWQASEVDMTARVVCEPCNNGWMSRLENDFAKPAMADLILGKRVGQIMPKRARGISLFAFKTAIIANRSSAESEFFFSKSERFEFRKSLTIPPNVSMWLFGMEPTNGGGIRSFNVSYPPDVTLNVCSFWIGQLGFQVVSPKASGHYSLESIPTPTELTFPFYPALNRAVRWPRRKVLGVKAFHDFSNRWNAVRER